MQMGKDGIECGFQYNRFEFSQEAILNKQLFTKSRGGY